MIVTRMSGGLGNQMFQYAIGLNLAHKNNDALLIDAAGYTKIQNSSKDTIRNFELDKFNISSRLGSNSEIDEIKYPLGLISKINRLIQKKILRRFNHDYCPDLLSKKGNVYLDGFFQSEKNFMESSGLIRKEFSLKQEFINGQATKILENISHHTSVSIHIRRGDYAQDKKTNKYHGLCPISYYENAISLITSKIENPHFFIFSDDIEWVKKNLPINHPHTFVSDGILIPQQEMYLMSKCKHNIIANSTFSWWGAWLNENPDKIVIAPKKWVNIEPNPHPNIIPETWITI